MDVGLQTGAVEKYSSRVDRLRKAQRLRGVGAGRRHGGVDELLMHGRHRRGAHPVVITFEGAFAGGAHAVDFAEAQEPLQQVALGGAHGKSPKTQTRDKACEIAPQRQRTGAGERRARLRAGTSPTPSRARWRPPG